MRYIPPLFPAIKNPIVKPTSSESFNTKLKLKLRSRERISTATDNVKTGETNVKMTKKFLNDNIILIPILLTRSNCLELIPKLISEAIVINNKTGLRSTYLNILNLEEIIITNPPENSPTINPSMALRHDQVKKSTVSMSLVRAIIDPSVIRQIIENKKKNVASECPAIMEE